jgi:hypothetical protein
MEGRQAVDADACRAEVCSKTRPKRGSRRRLQLTRFNLSFNGRGGLVLFQNCCKASSAARYLGLSRAALLPRRLPRHHRRPTYCQALIHHLFSSSAAAAICSGEQLQDLSIIYVFLVSMAGAPPPSPSTAPCLTSQLSSSLASWCASLPVPKNCNNRPGSTQSTSRRLAAAAVCSASGAEAFQRRRAAHRRYCGASRGRLRQAFTLSQAHASPGAGMKEHSLMFAYRQRTCPRCWSVPGPYQLSRDAPACSRVFSPAPSPLTPFQLAGSGSSGTSCTSKSRAALTIWLTSRLPVLPRPALFLRRQSRRARRRRYSLRLDGHSASAHWTSRVRETQSGKLVSCGVLAQDAAAPSAQPAALVFCFSKVFFLGHYLDEASSRQALDYTNVRLFLHSNQR